MSPIRSYGLLAERICWLLAELRSEAIAPIQNKIGKALMVPSLRNMLGQPRSTITLRRLMDEGAIVICNLSKGSLGESTAHLLGALLTNMSAQAALSRADMPAAERRVFHLYADEFQSFATESFALIVSEARKYGLTANYLPTVRYGERAKAAPIAAPTIIFIKSIRTGMPDCNWGVGIGDRAEKSVANR